MTTITKRIACIFPGQGSQSVGMLAEMSEHYPQVKKIFAEASTSLNEDLWSLVTTGPAEKLNLTEYTQPAMLTAGVVAYRLWAEYSRTLPIIMAGHSLGEYTALVCAGAVDFADAVKLVRQRGRIMQEAVPEGHGAMAAIVGLNETEVRELCQQASRLSEGEAGLVEPANYNAIGQTVVAGDRAAVERVLVLAEQQQAKLAKIIPVSVPCHCSLLRSAAEEFAEYLAKTPFYSSKIPVINNADVEVLQHPDDIRQSLMRQLYSPVRWVETIQLIARESIDFILECGPGRVLTGLTKRIDTSVKTFPIYDSETLKQALAQLNGEKLCL